MNAHSSALVAPPHIFGAIAGLIALATPCSSRAESIPLNESRHTFTLTKLADGRVLAIGGEPARKSCEIFDPQTNKWSFAASLSSPRAAHTAVRTLDGRVVVIGGTRDGQRTASVEIYDASTDSWQQGPTLAHSRIFHTSTLLPSGKILVAGGVIGDQDSTDFTEIVDINAMSVISAPKLRVPRSDHRATRVGESVVILGGHRSSSSVTRRVERFVEGSTEWEELESMNQGRAYFDAVVVDSESVLVVGGVSSNQVDLSVQRAELLSLGKWQYAGLTPASVYLHTCAMFADGRVLSVGGSIANTAAITSAVFAWNRQDQTWQQLPSLQFSRAYHSSVTLDDNRVLVAGGLAEGGANSELIELAPNGSSCVAGLQCKSAWCVDGVCCDSECTGPCNSCRGADNGLDDGICSYALKHRNPRQLCVAESSECGALGECDGAGQCAKVEPTTHCSGFDRCESELLHTGQCDGLGDCLDVILDCHGYACDSENGACRSECSDDTACLNTHYCNTQQRICVEKPPVRCLQDGVTLVKADDSTETCFPFRCLNDTCLKTCEQAGHCAPEHECTANGQCKPAQSPQHANFLCSTTGPVGAEKRGSFYLLGVGSLLALSRKRKRPN